MKLAAAKDMVLDLVFAGQPESARTLRRDAAVPDGDRGKFLINAKIAWAIHRFSGWHDVRGSWEWSWKHRCV